MANGIPKNQVRSIGKITQHEHCDDADAKRVKVVLKDGTPVDSANPFPVETMVTVGDVEVKLTRKDDDPLAGDIHDAIRIGNNDVEWDFKDKGSGLGEGRVADTLHCGGTSTVITVTDTPIALKVSAAAKTDRKLVFIQPRAKGLYWGFNSDVDTTNGVKGGAPLGKNQPATFAIEANTPIYIVGPASGIKLFIAEA